MPPPSFNAKRKRPDDGKKHDSDIVKKKSRRAPSHESEDDADVSSVSSAADSTGFAAAFDKAMARKVENAAPVMAKRHTAAAKIADAMKKEHKATIKKRRERRAAKVIRLELPTQAPADRERELRRLATKGVVALFNAITKHQKALQNAQGVDKGSGTSATAMSTGPSFLELLKQTSSSTIKSTAKSSQRAPKESAGSGKKWSVLEDDYLQNKDEESESDEDQDRKHRVDDVLGGSSDSD